MPGNRFLKPGDRLIEAVLAHVDEPEIVQRMPFRVAANFAAYGERLLIPLGRRVKFTEPAINLAEIVQRDTAERGGTRRLERGRRAPQVAERFLIRPVHPEMLAKRNGGMRFSERVAELLPDGQCPLKVRERLRVT